jgi:hypothetical protein
MQMIKMMNHPSLFQNVSQVILERIRYFSNKNAKIACNEKLNER